MVVEHDTIEEYVEVLSTFDSTDQLKLIAELTRRLADKVMEEPDRRIPDDVAEVEIAWKKDSTWDAGAELAKVGEAHRRKYGDVGDSWKQLAGKWETSTPDDLMERIRSDRGPENKPPNFDN